MELHAAPGGSRHEVGGVQAQAQALHVFPAALAQHALFHQRSDHSGRSVAAGGRGSPSGRGGGSRTRRPVCAARS
eukprot:4722739-Alexandrium_andersonii.AAC.1